MAGGALAKELPASPGITPDGLGPEGAGDGNAEDEQAEHRRGPVASRRDHRTNGLTEAGSRSQHGQPRLSESRGPIAMPTVVPRERGESRHSGGYGGGVGVPRYLASITA